MTTRSYLALYPRDGFFCKDGRGWHGTTGGQGYGLDWPWPSTIRGAVRSLWGRIHEPVAATSDWWRVATEPIVVERTLAIWHRRGHRDAERRWPVPVDVEYVEPARGAETATYLRPAPNDVATLGPDDDALRDRLWIAASAARGKPGPRPRWWTDSELIAWFTSAPLPGSSFDASRPVRRRVTRVALDATAGTAAESLLFSHDVVETIEHDGEWAIAAEVAAPDDRFAALASLGSDRRLARVDRLAATIFEPPAAIATASVAPVTGFRLALVTPAIFARGWLPDGLTARADGYVGRLPGCPHELVLRAAMTPRAVPISGWDMAARAPRPTDLAVAAGAVYFFQRTDGGSFTAAELCELWLTAIGRRAADGFGRVIAAPWSPLDHTSPDRAA